MERSGSASDHKSADSSRAHKQAVPAFLTTPAYSDYQYSLGGYEESFIDVRQVNKLYCDSEMIHRKVFTIFGFRDGSGGSF